MHEMVELEQKLRGTVKTLKNICNWDFSQQWLTAKTRQLFWQESSIIDIRQGPKFSSFLLDRALKFEICNLNWRWNEVYGGKSFFNNRISIFNYQN